MYITIGITQLSGDVRYIQVALDSSVDALRHQVHNLLGVFKGRLLTASGDVLRGSRTVEQSGLQNGSLLTLHTEPVYASASLGAFAAVLGDGSLACWGDSDRGGDCTATQGYLEIVFFFFFFFKFWVL